MIDIQGELLRIRQQREQEYISVVELLDFLKKYSPNSSYIEIATYLLIKLTPNDIRKTDDEIWGNEEFEYWIDQHGIAVFDVPSKIDEKVKNLYPNLFFEALETVRDFSDVPPYLFDDELNVASAYLKEEQLKVYIKRERIESLLNIKTIDSKKSRALEDNLMQKQIQSVPVALTKAEEFIKNIDIDKSPTGTAERLIYQEKLTEKDSIIEELQAKITELENQLQAQQSEVDSKEVLPVESKLQRISRPQRDIFTLLTVNNYPTCQSRNDLFSRINADLQAKGITTKDIQYSTLDNLIDEDIRLGMPKKSPFPPKQK
ncbi:hypothetical protein [Rodentibacter pneumotropicus]|uniref:hypothetical protein n=2 Tax=Rodentibacter pneumotropicus TaxID=758 RepID=UPI00035DEBE4|nr:hypothetical protein [Rodentibacter pneumotropicus]THA12707.1 hypothetical protein D3M82_10375 [Rodentibacter pneumotropicus]